MDKIKVLMTTGSLIEVESIAECSPDRVGCDFSDSGNVIAQIAIPRQLLGFMFVRWATCIEQ